MSRGGVYDLCKMDISSRQPGLCSFTTSKAGRETGSSFALLSAPFRCTFEDRPLLQHKAPGSAH